MSEHVELYLDADQQWRWRRTAANGEIIADGGEGYFNRDDCLEMSERVNPGIPIEQEEA